MELPESVRRVEIHLNHFKKIPPLSYTYTLFGLSIYHTHPFTVSLCVCLLLSLKHTQPHTSSQTVFSICVSFSHTHRYKISLFLSLTLSLFLSLSFSFVLAANPVFKVERIRISGRLCKDLLHPSSHLISIFAFF